MTKTSAKVKNRYNDKAYDRINLMVPKGKKEEIREFAASRGMQMNTFIKEAIEKAMNE